VVKRFDGAGWRWKNVNEMLKEQMEKKSIVIEDFEGIYAPPGDSAH